MSVAAALVGPAVAESFAPQSIVVGRTATLTITLTNPNIDELRSRRREILSMAARHGASDVRVFGSVLHGDDRPDSDIDLLVEVEKGRSLLDIIGLEQELEELLGRRVEVLTVGGLSPYLEQRILAEAARL